jgi:AbrB family looped-hinge helix DNA binding protein
MSKVTSKLQLTLPKALAEKFSIRPGDDVEWVAMVDALKLVPHKAQQASTTTTIAKRLRSFDAATARQAERQKRSALPAAKHRGWTREEIYGDRGRPR